MPNYNKPPMNNIPFEFTTGGYQAPDFSEVPFQWGLRPTFQQTANLQAAINVISQSSADLSALISSTDFQGYDNLNAYVKPTIQTYSDLVAAIRRLDQDDNDLGGDIHGWAIKDLNAEIGAHPPANLQAILNVIEIRDLPAEITGEWWYGQTDLGAEVYKIYQRGYKNLIAILHGWQEFDLASYINPVYKYDLQALIQSTTTADLGGSLFPIQPVDLQGLIHGWAISNLAAILIGGYGPYDIQASLNPIPGRDLSAIITGWKGFQIPIDLPASLSSWAITDLSAIISLIEAVDLGASITAVGKLANLGAIIIPKTILMKRALQISLLEHKDMKAVINFQCFGSAYSNLGASMHTIYKSELKAFIIGWFSGFADNVGDLGAYINAEDYYVEDKFTVTFVPGVRKYTQLNINFSVNDVYKTFDTLPIIYGSFYGANLSATINGILTSYDLGATVTPVLQTNYTELPENVNPKSHEIVIDFNDRWRENWRRFVEIMFKRDGAEPFHYFYVEGSNTIYRVDRDRHWTIWADSYLNTEDDMVERRDIRQKYIFNMSNYSTVDEAVRDLIDRVSTYRRASLGASIVGEWGPMANLSASIEPKIKYSWVKYLGASLTVQGGSLALGASITGL